ncbi:hypothetical protein Tsubulata_041256 [Turnera subulata]|uniref:F-box domain-containing protein n=1 Tax=Turnera subulata TaxID=218843 RepID=A0A9Q0EYD6_9ROSI|nr:hypothetical protein Tsubulata_041256 [Turnera subulata]
MELKLAKKKYEEITPRSFQRYDLLPDDALRLIFSKTSFVDHIRLKLVCKRWKRLLDGGDIRSTSILPWIMLCSWQPVAGDEGLVVEGLCKLYDPSHRKTYTLEDGITKRGSRSKERHKLVWAGILESKYGWVLFQKHTSLFLYCPFTSEVIDLPELEEPPFRATFSSNPTSADCLFFAYRRGRMGDSAATNSICLCRRGDQAWKTIQLLDSIAGSCFLRCVAYSNGAFYCLFEDGQLGAFNVATEQWDLLFSEKWQRSYYLFESDGQLFSLQLRKGFRISRFDFSSRNWVQGASPLCGHQAAFIQLEPPSLMLIPAVGEATQLAGTLNEFYSTKGVRHYSFKTNENLPLLDAYSKATIFSAGIHNKVWIQPPKCSS